MENEKVKISFKTIIQISHNAKVKSHKVNLRKMSSNQVTIKQVSPNLRGHEWK